MKIKSIEMSSYESGIPLVGWENVKNAVMLYSKGITKGSRATEKQLMADVSGTAGMMGLGLLMMAQAGTSPNQFVDNMLADAEKYLKVSDHWRVDYEYDGLGVFHKTTVKIDRLSQKEDLYLLGFNAAYVGNEPEVNLAEYLGIQLALWRKTVKVTLEPRNETRFVFDLVDIFETLSGPLETDGHWANAVLDHFMKKNQFFGVEPYKITSLKNIDALFQLGGIKSRYQRKGIKDKNTWTRRNGKLFGELDSRYMGDEKVLKDPFFTIDLRRDTPPGLNLPIWEEELKQRVDVLAMEIVEVMEQAILKQ